MNITPHPDFNWQVVSWGAPNEPTAEQCSYCDAPLDEDNVPLTLWNDTGWCARFCDACQAKYWGMNGL